MTHKSGPCITSSVALRHPDIFSRDWIIATANVKTVQELFSCELGLFTNKDNGRSKIAAWGSYVIPDEISGLVEMVSGETDAVDRRA